MARLPVLVACAIAFCAAVAALALANAARWTGELLEGVLTPAAVIVAPVAVLSWLVGLAALAAGAGLLLRRAWARPAAIAVACAAFWAGGLVLPTGGTPWLSYAVWMAAVAAVALLLSRPLRAWVGRPAPAPSA